MLPGLVQHTNVSAWGEDANNFDYMRFVPKPGQAMGIVSEDSAVVED